MVIAPWSYAATGMIIPSLVPSPAVIVSEDNLMLPPKSPSAPAITVTRRHARWLLSAMVLLVPVLLSCGCGAGPSNLMPTPNLYADGLVDPFLDIEPALQSNKADVVYMTDRAQEEGSTPDKPVYGHKRSRSLAFGVAQTQFGGPNVTWEQLVQASRSRVRLIDLTRTVARTTEMGRFQPTPRSLIELPGSSEAAAADEKQHAAEVAFRKLIAQKLEHTRVKEVYMFVHGYNNSFDDGATTIAQLWHFFGRQGVAMSYTWPAGFPGVLGYMYDRESSEFTVYHFKQTLKLLASCPEVRKVHIIGHSRGTDVVSAAMRELHLELAGTTGDPRITREAVKLGTVVLAAPDLDLDVLVQRTSTARIGRVPERMVIYVQPNDKALGISNWLFSGLTRLGEIQSNMFSPAELRALRSSGTPQIVSAQVTDTGAFGHDYFHSNPAVSSDLILLMRFQFQPGAENGRPLGSLDAGFWIIKDGYPGRNWKPDGDATGSSNSDAGNGDRQSQPQTKPHP